MQFTGQKAEQPASTACLLARKCNRLARKMAANMRNAICVRTQTSKVPTQDILLVSSLFCAFVVMYLCIMNIERAKNFGGNFRVNELLKLISLFVRTQDLIFRLRKLLSSVDFYCMGPTLQRNKYMQSFT